MNSTTDRPTSDSNDGAIISQNIPGAAILVVISIVGIVGNIFVIVAVQLTRRLQTSTNSFVVALSCIDFLTALTLPFQAGALLGLTHTSPSFAVVCEVIGALSFIFNGWSIITLITIAFNRYILITQKSHTYRRIFRKRSIAIMLICIFSYPLCSVMVFALTGWAVFGEKYNACAVADGRAFNLLSGVSMLTLMAAILYFYLKIYLHVRNHVRNVHVNLENQNRQFVSAQQPEQCHKTEPNKKESNKKEMLYRNSTEAKITKNMLFVVLCFFICMTPITIHLFATELDATMVAYFVVILSVNCSLNPIIYAWKHPVFHQVFRCILSRRLQDVEEPSRWLRDHLSNLS
ncbi:alpha-1B adrenergic receptor-like [Lytechinus variegatus]|uniref:alpha-1B adrenergic receptor-like n=1 Tax=Lytechinus variegatus TaxID=7654 RepID=UPI001BB26C54|nr:alpha-1B adrenergic receptor-like [Lytechinus variegatus]